MLTTTSYYKTAILAAQRDIKAKVEMYFDGDDNAATMLDSDNIANISFLEEKQAEGDTPLGAVSSNEIVLILRNDDKQFNPNNTESPYYGKLIPNIRVIPYFGIEITDASGNNSYEWISLGKYRTGDWKAPSGSITAEVTCYDRLYALGQKNVPIIPTLYNITRATMFETLFRAMGLASDNYTIDATLTDVVAIAWFTKGKVKDVLSDMTIAFNCTVFVTRDDKIKVANNKTVGSSVVTFADTNMLYTSDMPQKFEEIYSDVCVKYTSPTIKDEESILKIDDLSVPAEGVTLSNLEFSNAPIAFVTNIKLSKVSHISIGAISIGTYGMSLTLDNSASANEEVTLEVFGHPIETTDNEITIRDDTAYALVGEKILSINNYLVQTASEAETYANLILPIVTDPAAYVECDSRGDMSTELIDTITIQDTINKIGSVDIVPLRFKYTYTGGLRCAIIGIKKSALEGI